MMVRDRGQQVVSTAVFSQGILQNRIIESVELKGTSEGNLVQLPCNDQEQSCLFVELDLQAESKF